MDFKILTDGKDRLNDVIVMSGQRFWRFLDPRTPRGYNTSHRDDGTNRCIGCGQIDEPEVHERRYCSSSHPDFVPLFTPDVPVRPTIDLEMPNHEPEPWKLPDVWLILPDDLWSHLGVFEAALRIVRDPRRRQGVLEQRVRRADESSQRCAHKATGQQAAARRGTA